MKFCLPLLSFLFVSYTAIAQNVPTNKDCEVTEIIHLGIKDIETLKGKVHEETGLLGTYEYWETTQALNGVNGELRYMDLTNEYYLTYKLATDLTRASAEQKVEKLRVEISQCMGAEYTFRHKHSVDYKSYDIIHRKDEGAFFYGYPYVTVGVFKPGDSFGVEVVINFPQ